ncbi:deoxypodophyllotoxin synthase-like [Malania oleifera]|uniref:deoxypodophyllotoxin synthase-like n=1 Tax=Malania oleifera TaxID=397392 RepID=UPI0025ADA95F|nr:deoxypodophyllotoxin synthase-like [Malania oleifera]
MGSDEPAIQPKLKIPAIDFSPENMKPGTSGWAATRGDVRRALEEYGCFKAQFPSVTPDVDKAVFGSLEELFHLPRETKIRNTNEKPLYGYLGDQPPLPSIHESMGIENAHNLHETETFTKLMWPSGNDRFRDAMHSYAKLVIELDHVVKRMLFESYGVGWYFEEHVGSTSYLLRFAKYRSPGADECNIGAHCHTDKGIITIVRSNPLNGLEIKTKDGDWIAFDPSHPPTFIIFAGDALSAWSNDRIHSPQHQVVISKNETRYTIGLFSLHEGILEVPKELVDEEHPLKFKPFMNFELLKFFISDQDVNRKSGSCAKAYCGIET